MINRYIGMFHQDSLKHAYIYIYIYSHTHTHVFTNLSAQAVCDTRSIF